MGVGVERSPLTRCQVNLPDLDPVVLEPQPRAHLQITGGDGQLVPDLGRIEGALLGDLSHGPNSNPSRGRPPEPGRPGPSGRAATGWSACDGPPGASRHPGQSSPATLR